MTKSTRARYALEFKEEAVRLVKGGEWPATVVENLGLAEQTLPVSAEVNRRDAVARNLLPGS